MKETREKRRQHELGDTGNSEGKGGRGAAVFTSSSTHPTHTCAHISIWVHNLSATLSDTYTQPLKRPTPSLSKVCVPEYVCISCGFSYWCQCEYKQAWSSLAALSSVVYIQAKPYFFTNVLWWKKANDPSWLKRFKHMTQQHVWALLQDHWLVTALSLSGKLSLCVSQCAQDTDPVITQISWLLIRWARLSDGS